MGCEAAGCTDQDCAFDGLCHCGCGWPAPTAKQSERKRGYAKDKPVRFCPGHNRSGGTLMAADDGEPLLEAIKRAGLTRQGLSLRAGFGKGVVGDLVDLHGYRVSRDRCERIIAVLVAEYERADLDPAGLTLEWLFTAERPVDDVPGQRKRRPRRRRRAPIPPQERGDGRHFRERADEARAKIKAAGLLPRSMLLERLGLTGPTLARYEKRGRISHALAVSAGFTTLYGYNERAERLLLRELAMSDGAWPVRLRDPLLVYDFHIRHGRSPDRAGELVAAMEWRVANGKRVRIGTGRRSSTAERDRAWLEELECQYREIVEQLEFSAVDGEKPPTLWDAAVATAYVLAAELGDPYVTPEGELDPALEQNAALLIWNGVERARKRPANPT